MNVALHNELYEPLKCAAGPLYLKGFKSGKPKTVPPDIAVVSSGLGFSYLGSQGKSAGGMSSSAAPKGGSATKGSPAGVPLSPSSQRESASDSDESEESSLDEERCRAWLGSHLSRGRGRLVGQHASDEDEDEESEEESEEEGDDARRLVDNLVGTPSPPPPFTATAGGVANPFSLGLGPSGIPGLGITVPGRLGSPWMMGGMASSPLGFNVRVGARTSPSLLRAGPEEEDPAVQLVAGLSDTGKAKWTQAATVVQR